MVSESKSVREELIAKLDEISNTKILPKVAFRVINSAFQARLELSSRVYVALRDLSWRLVSSKTFGDAASEWYEVFSHAQGLAKYHKDVETYNKLSVLVDFISMSAKFGYDHPVEDVRKRKYTVELLALLESAKSPMSRIVLQERMKIGTSNLSRVLNILQTHGLVERLAHGKEADFRITAAGRTVLYDDYIPQMEDHSTGHVEKEAGDEIVFDFEELKVPAGIVNVQKNEFLANNSLFNFIDFEENISSFHDLCTKFQSSSRIANAEPLGDGFEVTTYDGQNFLFSELTSRQSQNVVIVGHNITYLTSRISDLQRKLTSSNEARNELFDEVNRLTHKVQFQDMVIDKFEDRIERRGNTNKITPQIMTMIDVWTRLDNNVTGKSKSETVNLPANELSEAVRGLLSIKGVKPDRLSWINKFTSSDGGKKNYDAFRLIMQILSLLPETDENTRTDRIFHCTAERNNPLKHKVSLSGVSCDFWRLKPLDENSRNRDKYNREIFKFDFLHSEAMRVGLNLSMDEASSNQEESVFFIDQRIETPRNSRHKLAVRAEVNA